MPDLVGGLPGADDHPALRVDPGRDGRQLWRAVLLDGGEDRVVICPDVLDGVVDLHAPHSCLVPGLMQDVG